MLELAYKALDLLLGALFGIRRVRVRVHLGTLLPQGEVAAFVKVVNLSSTRDVEITHVWVAGDPDVHVVNAERSLPVRLRPDETWETWLPLRVLPPALLNDLFVLFRVQLSNGTVVKSKQNRKVPAVGHVAGRASSENAILSGVVDAPISAPGQLPASPPNIVLLETRASSISFSVGSFIHSVGAHAPANGFGQLVVFVNRPLTTRPVGSSGTVKASMTFVSKFMGPSVNVVTGWWLGGAAQETTFEAAQARELLVVAHNDTGVYAVDARRMSRHETSPLYIPLPSDEYDGICLPLQEH